MRTDARTASCVEAFPWARVMHVGLSLLRLAPREFWAMTPAEFYAAAGGYVPRTSVFTRGAMEALMARFPDRQG